MGVAATNAYTLLIQAHTHIHKNIHGYTTYTCGQWKQMLLKWNGNYNKTIMILH